MKRINYFAALVLLCGSVCLGGERMASVTAFCNESPKDRPGDGCRKCCGRFAPANRCASGVRPIEGVTVACNWLPFGTVVKVEGFRISKTVQDRMASDTGFDIYFGSQPGAHKRAKKWGRRKLKVSW